MPIILTATPVGPHQIDLSLDLGEDMTSPIRLEISEDAGANWVHLDLPAGTVVYSHTGLPAEATRDYRASFLVQTVDAGSTSAQQAATTDSIPLGLAVPLHDAVAVYRAANVSPIPNEGTRSEALIFDSPGPVWTPDATLGGYLHYSPSVFATSYAPIPVAFLNGDVTFAIRLRPEGMWTARTILNIVDNPTNPLKHYYLTIGSNNTYLSRFWNTLPTRGQIAAQGNTARNGTVTDTVVVTWNGATLEHKMFLNGVLEASVISPASRTSATSSPFLVPFPNLNYKLACKVFAIACWNRTLSLAEIADLQANADWNHKA